MNALYFTKIKPLSESDKRSIKNLVSPQRLERSKLFSDEKHKEEFLFSEVTTSKVLKQFFGIEYPLLSGNAGEKPTIIGHPEMSFSRSYAENCLVIFIEISKKCGVDCEKIKTFDSGVLSHFFTENEKNFVNQSSDKNAAANVLWTRKESYIKYLGTGLEFPISNIDVTANKIAGARSEKSTIFENYNLRKCNINSYIFKGFAISVCSSTSDSFPEITEIQ